VHHHADLGQVGAEDVEAPVPPRRSRYSTYTRPTPEGGSPGGCSTSRVLPLLDVAERRTRPTAPGAGSGRCSVWAGSSDSGNRRCRFARDMFGPIEKALSAGQSGTLSPTKIGLAVQRGPAPSMRVPKAAEDMMSYGEPYSGPTMMFVSPGFQSAPLLSRPKECWKPGV
jgi:hypothetical protein